MNAHIHVVDDDADFRDALSWLFDSRGHAVAVWPGGEEFLQVAQTCCDAWGHAVVLLDIRMAPVSGLTTFERLKDMGCPWPVLFLTGHGDVSMAVTAVKSGAWDFLEKPFQNNVLVDKVEQALAEAQVRVGTSAEQQRLRLALANLSPRELEVLDELILGHYNKTIADHLGVTPRTIEFHRANIFEKLAVDSAIELAHKLGRYGLR
ncbi:MAG: response regulator [Burkholderiaceae bacterium]